MQRLCIVNSANSWDYSKVWALNVQGPANCLNSDEKRDLPDESILFKDFFQSPSKAIRSILIDSLNHQQYTAKLENSGANECCDSPSIRDFSWKLRWRILQRKPYKECVDAPDDWSQREYYSDEVRDVPVGVRAEHSPYSPQCFLGGTRGLRSKVFALLSRRSDDDGMST